MTEDSHDTTKTLQWVRENITRLARCSEHDFEPIHVEGQFPVNCRCARCGGVISNSRAWWYRKGYQHGRAAKMIARARLRNDEVTPAITEAAATALAELYPMGLGAERKLEIDGVRYVAVLERRRYGRGVAMYRVLDEGSPIKEPLP